MDFFITHLLGFLLIFTRIGAFFAIAPVFSWQIIPVRIKLGLILVATIFFGFNIQSSLDFSQIGYYQAGVFIFTEAVYGLALGLVCACLFFAVKVAAGIAEREMGFTMAGILDPMTGESGEPLGMIIETIFIMLFLSVNGHHFFLMLIDKSFQSYQIGTMPNMEILTESIIKSGVMMLLLGLRIAAPILAAFILLLVVLAVLARIAPEMNILFISLPVRVGVGLTIAALFMPFIYSYIEEFRDWVSQIIII